MAEPIDLLRSLDRSLSLSRKQLLRYDAYYEGEQPLRYMAAALEAEIGANVTQLVLNWPRLCADAYEHCLDVLGFRYDRDEDAAEELWDLWQANDGDEQSQQAHLESLICGRSYVIVGSPEDDDAAPVFTVEHPLQVIATHDPKTRKVSAGLKRWQDDDKVQWGSLYLPDRTITYRRQGRNWEQDTEDVHDVGEVLVVPIVNRGRMLRQMGISEFHDVIPIADAANKMATDMMISGEFHAMPRRYAIGMTEGDFVDENDNPLSTWSIIAGRLWATDKKPGDVSLGQFTESDLAVFHNTIKVLAQLAAQLMYLPQDYMSFTSDNPTSADAMRSSEARKVKRAERMQTVRSGPWEQVQRLMLRIQTGEWDPKARKIETIWRDPSTPTQAQAADRAVKLVGQGIIPVEQAQEDLGYTPAQRERFKRLRREAIDTDLLGSLAEQFRVESDPANAGT